VKVMIMNNVIEMPKKEE